MTPQPDLGAIDLITTPGRYLAQVKSFPPEVSETRQRCDGSGAVPRRQNTNYTDARQNRAVLCATCQAEADEFWAEQWREYNSRRI